MTHPTTDSEFKIGASPKRLEDQRFLRGEGSYLDDRKPEQCAHAAVLRSPHAHAYIELMDTSAALASAGVLAILTSADAQFQTFGRLPPTARENPHTGQPFHYEDQPLLAVDRVRHVGEAVAVVVAMSRAQALDAAEQIEVTYRPLPAVTTCAAARASGAPALSQAVKDNVCLDWDFGDSAAVQAIVAKATHVVHLHNHNHRIITNSMEPRGATGWFDSASGKYRLEAATQNVHVIRDMVAGALAIDPELLDLRAPDVGGGFGLRNFAYPEYALVLWAARTVGRPVNWLNSRSDGFVSDHQARDFTASASLALDAGGRFLALHVSSQANVGAYMIGAGCGVQTGQYTALPGGVYDIPALHLSISAVLTNTVPIGVTRGPGFAEAVDVIERLIDKAARETGLDRFELRRRNLVSTQRMPWTNAAGTCIDSGDFHACFEAALAQADTPNFEARRAASTANGRLRGLGLACHIKATGGLPEENVHLEFLADGLRLSTGTQAIGQGHETSFRQILGSLLGLTPDQIAYRAGDTRFIPMGGGHGSSRATYMAGTAMALAANEVIRKGSAIAAQTFNCNAMEIEFADGLFKLPRSNLSLPLLEVARLAHEAGAPLDTYRHFTREAMTFPNGCHVAEVEIDPQTGVIKLLRYTAVDDYGVQVNPMLVEGQAHGAIAQGVGQTLMECARYEPESGQLLTGSFMDYGLPRADDLPALFVKTLGTPCTTNPLGVKGCGEAGAVAGFPALANALLDALTPFGVTSLEGPATPFAIWSLISRHSTAE